MPSYKIFINQKCHGPQACNLCKPDLDKLQAGDIHQICAGQITVSQKSFETHCNIITDAMKHCPQGAIDFAEL